MKLDLSNAIDSKKFEIRCEYLKNKNAFVDLTEVKPIRSNQQNKYLHLLFTWFAIEYGERVEYVKQEIFKKVVNKDTFKEEFVNKKTGEVRDDWRSTKDLDSSEMTKCIDRFRTWSGIQGIYLPEANEIEFLKHIERESDRYGEYL